MTATEEKVRNAVARLRRINYEVAADKLERSIKEGTIDLKPQRSETELMIYAALIFSDVEIKLNIEPTYVFETK